MKKIIISILFIVFFFGSIDISLAADNINGNCMTEEECSGKSGDGKSKPTTVIVTEKIPGGDCVCIANGSKGDYSDLYGQGEGSGEESCKNPATRKYSCTVQPGLVGFQKTFASIIRYVIYIVMLLGVLGIVGLGIAWSFAGGDDIKAKSSLKKWGVNILVGLTILFLFSYILRFLAPWIYQ